MILRPFFTYFGGKWRNAPHYPVPKYGTIIEPFAGSAGYSLRYPERRIVLIEKSKAIAGIWDFLIRARESEILALPLLKPGQSVDTLPVPQEARWLIGMCINPGSSQPKKTRGSWTGADYENHHGMCTWSSQARARIARQVSHIRHWRILNADYSVAADVPVTWYVDPPYRDLGRHYPHGSAAINFSALATWCQSRRGQVIVCESAGADWLPFRFLGSMKAKTGVSREAIWTNA